MKGGCVWSLVGLCILREMQMTSVTGAIIPNNATFSAETLDEVPVQYSHLAVHERHTKRSVAISAHISKAQPHHVAHLMTLLPVPAVGRIVPAVAIGSSSRPCRRRPHRRGVRLVQRLLGSQRPG